MFGNGPQLLLSHCRRFLARVDMRLLQQQTLEKGSQAALNNHGFLHHFQSAKNK
jgi:hypothetical protein